MRHLPEICPVCKNKDNLYFIKTFTGVSNLMAELTFVRFLPEWAKAIEDEFLNAFALRYTGNQKVTPTGIFV